MNRSGLYIALFVILMLIMSGKLGVLANLLSLSYWRDLVFSLLTLSDVIVLLLLLGIIALIESIVHIRKTLDKDHVIEIEVE